jgi:hypothetical protein
MSTIRCVEPAKSNEGDGYVVVASSQESVVFPGVDSCLAIAFIMSDNRYICGHVGMQWGMESDLEPTDNTLKIVEEMLGQVNNKKISKVIFVGDPHWDSGIMKELWGQMEDKIKERLRPTIPAVRERLKKIMPPPNTFLSLFKGEGKGIDVLLTRESGMNIEIICKASLVPKKLYRYPLPFIKGDTSENLKPCKK